MEKAEESRKDSVKRMKSEIENPYQVNSRLYKKIIGISLVIVWVSWIFREYAFLNYFAEMFNSIGYGCIGSAAVAWILDIRTTADKNEKANALYESAYQTLFSAIYMYIEGFPRVCKAAFGGINFSKEKHTWYEWFELIEQHFDKCNEKRKRELVRFFVDVWQNNSDQIREASMQILRQQNLLEANDVINSKIKNLVQDIFIEFKYSEYELHARWWLKPGECASDKPEDFLSWVKAGNEDLKRYIESWKDIRYYNYYRFSVDYNFLDKDLEELHRAVSEAEKAEASGLSD